MNHFMAAALEEAKLSLQEGNIPIGSILVKDTTIIGKGRDTRVKDNNPIGYAELNCLRNAGRIDTYNQTALYITLMPCYIGAGALVQYGIPRVFVAEAQTCTEAQKWMAYHGIEVINVDLQEAVFLIKYFIQRNPDLWNLWHGTTVDKIIP
jgi:cytosine/creatinine deaminase